MMPIWSGLAPAFSSFVVIFSTFAASVLRKAGIQFPGLHLWTPETRGYGRSGAAMPPWGHPVLDQESQRGQKKLTTHTYKNNLLNIKQHAEKQNENMLWPEKPEQNRVRRAVSDQHYID